MRQQSALAAFALLELLPAALGCLSCGSSRFPTPGACVVDGARHGGSSTATAAPPPGCCADEPALELLGRLLDVLGGEALEATRVAVARGDSPFGAAVLRDAPGYPLLHADANQVQTARTPTAHGEISTINSYFGAMQDQPPPGETVFLSTHQPCSMCMSALAFAGFRRVFYGFDFGMAVNGGGDAGDVMDAAVIEELFGARCALVNHTNGMFTYVPVRALLGLRPCGGIAGGAEALAAARQRFEEVTELYRSLGREFQARMAAVDNGGGLQLMGSACQGCKPYPRPECLEAAPAAATA